MVAEDPRDGYALEHEHGGMSKWRYEDDPRHLLFCAARYKHTAKILEGAERVLEVGCSDGFGARIVRQHVGRLTAIDADARSIEEAQASMSERWPVHFHHGDLLDKIHVTTPSGGVQIEPRWIGYDAVYSLDVLEHIRPDGEFLSALRAAAPVAVIGMPSAESQKYASPQSLEGHVNCYSAPDLKARLREYWDNVFVFTIHDETLGTSYAPMAQYLLALCVR